MDHIVLVIGQRSISTLEIAAAAAGLAIMLLIVLTVSGLLAARSRRIEAAASAERQREIDDRMAELATLNAELMGRLSNMGDMLGSRQVEMARLVADRLEAVGSRVGQGLESSGRTTADHLAKLGERLAVIDAAQARLAGLTQEVVGLKDILANKQTRGAFGQGRMEAIVRDGLAGDAYEFQFTLPNNTRPDCIVRLPGDERVMAVDAKFPLEAFSALKDATSDDERARASQRVRADVGKHVRDIAEKYLLPGVTQDIALMFVPSESIYADLNEHFEDVVQKAHRAQVVIVSPSLLMMAIQLMQTMVRDRKMHEQAHFIQREVRNLLDDVRRLGERVAKLDQHFRQAQDDVTQIVTSSEKITRRGARIDQMEFPEPGKPAAALPPVAGLSRAAE